ncbi:hypothetical protein ACSBR1_040968 [Camellia fascicularis]
MFSIFKTENDFISSATISAVKRSKHSHEGKTEFLAELTIIASLRHKNLVQLQGWCIEKDELLLVYEFMPNRSLDQPLFITRAIRQRPSKQNDEAEVCKDTTFGTSSGETETTSAADILAVIGELMRNTLWPSLAPLLNALEREKN